MRHREHIIRRNEAIRERFHLLYSIEGKRYEFAMTQLSREFFLQPETISKIIRDAKNNAPNQTEKGV